MLTVLIALGIFGTILLLLQGIVLLHRVMSPRGTDRAVERIQKWSAPETAAQLDIVRKESLSDIPWLHNLLITMRRFQPLRLLHRQADCRIPLGTFVLATPLLALGALLLALMIHQPLLLALLFACILGALPAGYLYWLKSRRMAVFQIVADGLPSEFPSLRALGSVAGNLPQQLSSFVGRDQLMADAAELVRSNRLVTLSGVGGVGKTRLALEVGAELADEFPDGVWLVELASVGDPSSVSAAIATVLGLTPQGDTAMSGATLPAVNRRPSGPRSAASQRCGLTTSSGTPSSAATRAAKSAACSSVARTGSASAPGARIPSNRAVPASTGADVTRNASGRT